MGQSLGKAGVNDDGDGEILFVVNIESKFTDPNNGSNHDNKKE
jgi:hypothetical protein